MVFSSLPSYFDSSNWHQNQQIIGGNSSSTNHLLPPPAQPHGGGIRPGSLAERARLANIPIPEASQKCPRCESTNTKFCYFNNYSLSQPRHFCKTCRRYWTKGGALRNVPVGGGCRRNKRSKSRSSMSPASTDRQTNTSSTNTASTTNSGGLTPQLQPLRFMSPLSTFTGDLGLHYNGISPPVVPGSNDMNFNGLSNVLGSGTEVASLFSNVSGNNIDPWRFHQLQPLSFMGGLEVSPPGIYRFSGGESSLLGLELDTASDQVRPKTLTPISLVKREENRAQLNLSRQIVSGIQGNDHWNGAASWNELSGFSSSSTNNPL